MKNLPWIGLGLLAFLIVSTQLPASADVVEEARRYFSDEEIQLGRSFALQRRWIFWANAVAQLAVLVYLAFTPLGKRVYVAAGDFAKENGFAHLALLFAAYFAASAAVGLPFRVASYFLNVSWEMTEQSFFGWLRDHLLGLVVTAVLEGAAVLGFYAIVRSFPRIWWLVAGAASVVFGFAVAVALPTFIDPLFNVFTPIAETPWKHLEPRIKAMGSRVGASSAEIYVKDASRQTAASNAYFTGFAGAQRIVLYDNLLKNHSSDEVETVIAHEMGHWWHRHIFQGILLGGLAATAGFYLLFRYLEGLVDRGSLSEAGDVAGFFRVVLLAMLALAVTLPIQRGISRRMEGQADEAALALSKKPDAFIAAEIRLAKQNKMDVAPSRWNTLLFASHPPVVSRIHYAEKWKEEHPDGK